MSYRADKLVIDTHTLTHRPIDAADDNTRRPKLASGKNLIYLVFAFSQHYVNVYPNTREHSPKF